MPGRRHWLIAAVCGALLAMFLWWTTTGSPSSPEVRIAGTQQALSALIVDGDERVLILNANGPQDARSVLGTLSRPWEPEPSTLIIGADRRNVAALWEALHRLRPRQLIVAGAPGADPDWSEIERYCRENAIEIAYLEDRAEIGMATLNVTVVAPDSADRAPSYVLVDAGETRAAIGLGGLPATGRLHLAVADASSRPDAWSDVLVTTDGPSGSESATTIMLSPGERITAIFDGSRIRIQGRAEAKLPER